MRTPGAAAWRASPRLRRIGGWVAVLALAIPGPAAFAAEPAATKPAAAAATKPAVAAGATATPIEAAEAAASAWLSLIDAAEWVPAWNATGTYLHATVGEAKWLTSIARVRLIAGALVSRRLKSAYETTYLPGAPYGHYVVVYYASRFAHRNPAGETLTLMKDSAGAWRVVGYYVK